MTNLSTPVQDVTGPHLPGLGLDCSASGGGRGEKKILGDKVYVSFLTFHLISIFFNFNFFFQENVF